jgi:hypothetical protein
LQQQMATAKRVHCLRAGLSKSRMHETVQMNTALYYQSEADGFVSSALLFVGNGP